MRSRWHACPLLAAVAAAWAIAPAAAEAHKVNVWAAVEGTAIRGRAYFHGGSPAQEAKVEALAPDGRVLARATTGPEGDFSVEAKHRCAYRLVVDAGGGHAGQYTVPAEDLPQSLAPYEGAEAQPGAASPPAGDNAPPDAAAPASGPSPSGPSADHAALKEMIEAAVQRQVAPLERRLQEYQEKARVSDLLGGIGYIVGITGMLFYVLGTRKRRRQDENAARLPKP